MDFKLIKDNILLSIQKEIDSISDSDKEKPLVELSFKISIDEKTYSFWNDILNENLIALENLNSITSYFKLKVSSFEVDLNNDFDLIIYFTYKNSIQIKK